MSIDVIENNTKVKTPDGRVGKIQVTRRERMLIAQRENIRVKVRGSDGLCRSFFFSSLEEIPYIEPEVKNMSFEEWFEQSVEDPEYIGISRTAWYAGQENR